MRLRKRTAQALLMGALAIGLAPAALAQTSDTFTIGASSTTVTEGTDVAITITRTLSDFSQRTIAIQTSGGAGVGIEDGTTNREILWSTNVTELTLNFPTTDDTADESDATVTFTLLGNPIATEIAYAIGTPASVTVTVQDNDEPAAAPAVTGVSLSALASGDTFGAGEAITVTVDYGVNLTVTGAPRLPLAIGDITRYAAYDGTASTPSGDTNPGRLVFTYTVQGGDNDADGISVPGPIDLAPGADGQNTAAIAAETGGTAANLALGTHAIANSANHKVATPKPELTISTTTATVTEGGDVSITVTRDDTAGASSFNVNLTVTAAEGHSKFGLPDRASRAVAFTDGSATATVVLSTTNDQLDNPGGAVTIALETGSSYTVGSTGNSVAVTVSDNDEVPGAPTINSITPTGKTARDDTSLVVDWTLPTSLGLVDGVAANLELDLLALDVQVRCISEEGNDADCLAYDFETGTDVQNEEWRDIFHNLSADQSPIEIRPLDPDTKYEVRLRLETSVGHGDWGSAGPASTVSDDTPEVTSVLIEAPANGDTFYTGEEIHVRVIWDSELDVTGAPRLALWFGPGIDTLRWADYSVADSRPAGYSTGGQLDFKYRVQAGDQSDGISIYDDISTGNAAIHANGGTIRVHCSYLDIHGGTQNGEQIQGDPDCVANALFARLDVGEHEIFDSAEHKVDGSDVTPPALTEARVGGTTLVLFYDEALDTGSVPAVGDFTVTVAGTDGHPSGVAVTGSTVTLTLASEVTETQTVTLTYVPGTNPIRDEANNNAAALSNYAVTVDSVAPALRWATVRDDTLALIYNEALAAGSVPAAGAFTVMVDSAQRRVNAVAVADRVVSLTLASAVTEEQAVTVSYTVPTAINDKPIQDLVGNDAAALTNQDVTNVTRPVAAVIEPISITSKPASGDTYGIDETITVEIGFAPPVHITGTPELDLEIGGYTRAAVCSDGGTMEHVTVLSCSYTVQQGDVDADGLSIFGNALFLDAGDAITTVDGGAAANLAFTTVPSDPEHKVNGGALPSELEIFDFDSEPVTFRRGETIRVRAIYYPTRRRGGNAAGAADHRQRDALRKVRALRGRRQRPQGADPRRDLAVLRLHRAGGGPRRGRHQRRRGEHRPERRLDHRHGGGLPHGRTSGPRRHLPDQ